MNTKVYKISDEKYHYTSSYYSQNKWTRDGDVILARSEDKWMKDSPTELVRYSLKEERVMEVLCDDVDIHANYVVHENMVYYSYGQGIKSLNLSTGKVKIIYMYQEAEHCMTPHISNDGKFLSTYIHNQDNETEFIVINLETEESRVLCKKKFAVPFEDASHGMICPTNPEIMFFCHEGITFYISNRLWIYDARKDQMWNLAKQELDEEGNLGDCFGHECWAPDGRGMYFVKYACSPTPPSGICYVDIETGKTDLLFSKYNYWHVGVSRDGRYLTADTNMEITSKVVLIDIEKKTETVIDTAGYDNHPAHPHPALSPDNSKLIFTDMDEKGRVYTKIICLDL